MRNVFILSPDFYPHDSIAARRFSEMTPFFAEAGWRPIVFAAKKRQVEKVLIPEEDLYHFLDLSEVPVNDVGAVANPGRAKRIISGYLEKRGYSVHALGTDYSFCGALEGKVREVAARHRPDLIIATYPVSYPFWSASRLSQSLGVPWIADFRDLGALRDDNPPSWVRTVDRILEKRNLKSAAGITTVSPTLRDMLTEAYRKPVEVIYNGYRSARAVDTTRPTPRREGSLTLMYAGGIMIQQMSSASLLLRAMQRHPDVRWRVRSTRVVALWDRVKKEAAELGVLDRIEFLGEVPKDVLNDEIQEMDAMIVFEDLAPTYRFSAGTLTGKLLELLGEGRPIISIARRDSDIGAVLKSSGAGELCSDDAEIDSFINRLRAGQITVGRDVDQFSRRNQAHRLCAFADRLVGEAS